MKYLRAFAAALFFPVVAVPLHAAMLSQINYAGWAIGAYSDDDTGAFSHCAASVPYKSGTTLLFGLGTGGWTIGLANPSWNIPKGAKYPVVLQVDRNQAMSLTAVAITSNAAAASLETSSYLFQMFRRGRLLRIQAAGELLQFDLTNSAKVLDMTLACAEARLQHLKSNPFSADSSAPPAPAQSPITDHKAEVTAFLANVLSAAGIQGFSLSPQVSPDLKPWEVAWTAPSIIGLARIDEGSTVQQAALLIAASDGSVCKGSFASAKQVSSDGSVVSLKTACSLSDASKSTISSYTIVPRAAGGSFIAAALSAENDVTGNGSSAEVGPRLLQASEQYLETSRPKK